MHKKLEIFKKYKKSVDRKGKKWYNIQAYNYYGCTLTSFQKSNVKKYGGVINMAAKGPRENITLECTECKRRNYMTSKNKRNNTDRLEIVKYCKFCKKRTTHKETK